MSGTDMALPKASVVHGHDQSPIWGRRVSPASAAAPRQSPRLVWSQLREEPLRQPHGLHAAQVIGA